MITWVGYTNTFLASIASLLTAVATLVYVIRTKKATQEIKQTIEQLPNGDSGATERPLG